MLLLLAVFITQMKSLFACTSKLDWNPKFYRRDPFPRCYPTYSISDEKPTVVSLNGSGGVVSQLPHDLTLWRNVIRRLETQVMEFEEKKVTTKPNLTLVFVGGSMLSGVMQSEFSSLSKCFNYTSIVNPLQEKRECAYPARFGDWLQAAYPQAAVRIYNFGVGGSVSAGALTKLTPMLDTIPTSIDIVFLHYLNNDALPALQEKNMEVSMGYEDIVRHFLLMGAAVIDLPMFVDYLPKRFHLVNGVLRTHEIVTSYYKVPVLAIEHNNSLFSKNAPDDAPPRPVPPPPNPLPWNSSDPHCGNVKQYLPVWMLNSHPSWIYHQVLADFLRYAWKFQRNAICMASGSKSGLSIESSYKLPPLISAFNRTVLSAYCVSTISRCTPSSIVNASVYVDIGSSWVLGEDRKGNKKAGWWTNSPDGGAITFTIDAYESDSVIILSYLSSYSEDMGSVSIFADGDPSKAIVINSRKAHRKASLFEYQRLCIEGAKETSLLFCKKRESSTTDAVMKKIGIRNITVRLLPKQGGNKFKIMGLYSC